MSDVALRIREAAGGGSSPSNPGETVPRSRGLCVRAAELSAVREDSREVDFVCSTDVIDSYGEIVRQNWNLKRFAGNPVALWSHQAQELPVGYWKNVRVEDGALRGTLVVVTAEANPKAEHVWQSILQKSLRAVSVGFMPHKVSFEEIEGEEVCVLDENELFEISPTPLPANPDALIDLRARAFEAYVEKRVLEGRGAIPYEAFPPKDTGGWDAAAAVRRIRKWASADGSGSADHIDWTKYRKAFGWMDPQRTHEFGGFKLPHHDILDGALVTVRGGVIAAGNALVGSRGGVKIPPGDVAAVKSHLAKHYHQFDLKAPWEDQGDKSTAPAEGPTKEARVGAKQKTNDIDEAAKKAAAKGMITCPACGEEFDPDDEGDEEDDEKSKACKQANRSVFQKAVGTVKQKLADSERARGEAEKARDEVAKANKDLQVRLVELELEPLVGSKITPAEKQSSLDLAAYYATQGDEGKAKWASHLAALRARTDLTILGSSVLPKDSTQSGLTTASATGGGSELAALVNEAAQKG